MERRYRDPIKERWIQIIGYAVLMGIVLGIFIHLWSAPLVVIREAEAATTTPEVVEKVVMIEVEYSKEGIERLIRETFPEAPNTAVAVAKAESELNSDAFNPEAHVGCNGSIGIFQMACVHNRKDPEALKDVETNIKRARALYLQEGWKPWGAYTDGRWRQYLD